MANFVENGIFPKADAYGLLKEFIGIKRKCTINRRLFNACFVRVEEGKFSPVVPLERLREIFKKNEVPVRNNLYWEQKTSQNIEAARTILNETIFLVTESIESVKKVA